MRIFSRRLESSQLELSPGIVSAREADGEWVSANAFLAGESSYGRVLSSARDSSDFPFSKSSSFTFLDPQRAGDEPPSKLGQSDTESSSVELAIVAFKNDASVTFNWSTRSIGKIFSRSRTWQARRMEDGDAIGGADFVVVAGPEVTTGYADVVAEAGPEVATGCANFVAGAELEDVVAVPEPLVATGGAGFLSVAGPEVATGGADLEAGPVLELATGCAKFVAVPGPEVATGGAEFLAVTGPEFATGGAEFLAVAGSKAAVAGSKVAAVEFLGFSRKTSTFFDRPLVNGPVETTFFDSLFLSKDAFLALGGGA